MTAPGRERAQYGSMGFRSPWGHVVLLSTVVCGCSNGVVGRDGLPNGVDIASSNQDSFVSPESSGQGESGSVVAPGPVGSGSPAASGTTSGSRSSGSSPGVSSGASPSSGSPTSGSSTASGTSSGSVASGSAVGSGSTSGHVESGSSSGAAAGTGSGSGSVGGGVSCKRGIASDAAPSDAFAPTASVPGVTWWYNWGTHPASGGSDAIEFDPMMANAGAINSSIPDGSKFLLGFNEPDFKTQGDLSPQQAAADWPALEAKAKAAGIPIVSPGVNFCGSASNTSQCTTPTITDPYTWLKDFFVACSGCEVDYVAIHWYNCDLPSLQTYIEGDNKGTFEGFTQFGKPIWVTEFSCDATHSVADQTAYMEAAVPYLEGNPNIFRYSWFSAAPIPNAELAKSDGSLTALGATYVGLPENCR
jgi:Glycosyl hydrolase catalytic core